MPAPAHLNTAPSWPACQAAKDALNAEIAANGKHSPAVKALEEAYSDCIATCEQELGYNFRHG